MKKIYSILLMAVALLISTNLKADVTTYAELLDALESATNGSTIKLGANIELEQNQQLYFNHYGAEVTLDLNGYNITTTALKSIAMFHVYAGTLNVTGTGEIKYTAGKDHEIFRVFGTNDLGATNYTTLNIGENVTLTADGTGVDSKGNPLGGKTITVCELKAANQKVYKGNETAETVVDYLSVLKAKSTNTEYSSNGLAEGVVVNIYGTVTGSQYGVKINGNVRSWSYLKNKKYPQYTSNLNNTYGFASEADSINAYAHAPRVNIYSTAIINADATSTDAAAVYSSGYGRFEIAGNVSGATAVYVKSGSVTLNDATISSTGEYSEIVGKGSGVSASGSAIVIESNASFSGENNITINGDTKITSENGYAIEENITTATESKTESIIINGGTITGSEDKGAIVITDDTKNSADSIIVYGANITGEVAVGTTGDLSDILPSTVSQTTITVDGKTTVVVSTGSTESAGTTEAININSLTEDENYDFSNLTADAISGSTLTVSGSLKLGKVVLNNPNAAIAITIPENATLEVEQLTMNETASITVKAGGKLIVSGNQGIYAPSVDNIIIEADGTTYKQGEFYFNPAVNSNKHPNATVQMVSKAYQEGSTYHWQRFGVPAWEHMTPSQILKENAPTAYSYWDNENNEWAAINVEDFGTFEMKPFVGYELTTTNTTAGAVYSFPCALYGNVNVDLAYRSRWNYFANSYTGGMDLRDMLLQLLNDAGDKLEGGVFVHKSATNTWDGISYGDLDEHEAKQSKLDPMQAFIIYNKSSEAVNNAINYENVVWNHRGEAKVSQSPARRATLDYDKAKVIISADGVAQSITLRQAESFSDAYDRGYDLTKFMQGSFNIYAETENGNLEQVATDNLVGKTITVNTNSVKSFKMTFENLNGETFAIRDNVTGSVIDMTEGAEYYFTADAYNGENRFEIVEARKMPTDVEVVDAAKAQKGIYSLVGAYLGEDLDVLPAGIYVVNGVKVVK